MRKVLLLDTDVRGLGRDGADPPQIGYCVACDTATGELLLVVSNGDGRGFVSRHSPGFYPATATGLNQEEVEIIADA